MNRYENITIIDADVGEDEKNALLERIESQISKRNGALIEFDDWGMRKLAYEIRKKRQGQYVRTDFCGNGEIVDAIERMLQHDQRVLRFMTIRLEENADPEAIKASLEEKKQAAPTEPAAQPQQAAAAAKPEPVEEPEAAVAQSGSVEKEPAEAAAETEESTPESQQKEQ
ncbi:MAG: 30S ribosomal protein S6 [Desulfosalsimonas sp.]